MTVIYVAIDVTATCATATCAAEMRARCPIAPTTPGAEAAPLPLAVAGWNPSMVRAMSAGATLQMTAPMREDPRTMSDAPGVMVDLPVRVT